MQIQLAGQYSDIYDGLKCLQADYDFEISAQAHFVLKCKRFNDTGFKISYHNENAQATIHYDQPSDFFRGFSYLLEKQGTSFTLTQKKQMKTVGPMIDFSRNGILNSQGFKAFIHRLAMMGFNAAMLYMEDTYEVASEKYFGYLRGRLSQAELKEMDRYAAQFGIELIPCIQTLAHLEEFLKWPAAKKYQDTRGAVMVENDHVYDLLERMITDVSVCFKSRRIHIGMDEAEEIGRGRYLNEKGFKPRFDMMKNHLEKVLEITRKLDLDVMMWSDMFLKLASDTGDYYSSDVKIPDDIIEQVPADVQMVYWQYNSNDRSHYDKILKQHQAFKGRSAFAGGMWIWNTFGVNYHLSLQASKAAIASCKAHEVDDLFVTLWGDDGQETTPFHALLGLQYYAEHAYQEEVNEADWHARAAFCTGIEPDLYLLMNKLDRPPGVTAETTVQTNPSKFLLWQDLLLGLFDKHIEKEPVGPYYADLAKQFKAQRDSRRKLDFLFDVPEKLCQVLAIKADLGNILKKTYDQKDYASLEEIYRKTLEDLSTAVQKLRHSHREQWHQINKSFGFEVIDIRYGGLLARIDTVKYRLEKFLKAEIAQIEELQEEKLHFDPNVVDSEGLGWNSYYFRMASPNVFFHVLPIY